MAPTGEGERVGISYRRPRFAVRLLPLLPTLLAMAGASTLSSAQVTTAAPAVPHWRAECGDDETEAMAQFERTRESTTPIRPAQP